jgi:hypothetical protein
MNKYLAALAGLAAAVVLFLALCPRSGRAQQPYGATFPGGADEPRPARHPLLQGGASSFPPNPFTMKPRDQLPRHVPVEDGPEPNQDIVVTPEVGDWMICVMTYEGSERHKMARKFVAELRSTNRLPAYIFNHGRKENLEEERRIQRYIEEQRRNLKNLENVDPRDAKITIRRVPIKETTAVLIGGYKTMAIARRGLDDLKRLPCPDPKRVSLDMVGVAGRDKNGNQTPTQEWIPANPFLRSLVVPNPSVPRKAQQPTEFDIHVLRHLNSAEPYSLLRCGRKITLAIKEYRVPTHIQSAVSPNGSGANPVMRNAASNDDYAAVNAHNLAESLHQLGVEVYVLHTPLSSIVSIGAVDNANDPRLRDAQQKLAEWQTNRAVQQALGVFPGAWPMRVPQ